MLNSYQNILLRQNCSGKELIMTNSNVSNMLSMMGSYFSYYFKACFFAGLFRRGEKNAV